MAVALAASCEGASCGGEGGEQASAVATELLEEAPRGHEEDAQLERSHRALAQLAAGLLDRDAVEAARIAAEARELEGDIGDFAAEAVRARR
eukprot:9906888-Lingulodinium_polyedra.AAC.1